MEKAGEALKRIPRIRFPQRHPKPSSGSASPKIEAASTDDKATLNFFSGLSLKSSTAMGGKASLQPKRTPVTEDEIEAILLGGCN